MRLTLAVMVPAAKPATLGFQRTCEERTAEHPLALIIFTHGGRIDQRTFKPMSDHE
jgi:hypothetical protein